MVSFRSLFLSLSAAVALRAASSTELCSSPTNTYTGTVNLYSSELGNYQFDECGDVNNPTIAMEVGETYTFVQKDRTNYFHPFGFAYSAFGDEELKLELEPGITKDKNSNCAETLTCPAPMYFINDEYQGRYSNIPEVKNVTQNEMDFGIDAYEPLFTRPPAEWTGHGNFTVKLRFDVESPESLTYDLFYFCHLHEWLVGRIKLTQNGVPLVPIESPALGFTYDEPLAFDAECGTYGLGPYALPHPNCPERFVCGIDGADDEMHHFSSCLEAMNCHMMNGMTTGIKAHSEKALFLHHMIPHHQNAVNMAKTLLKTNKLNCEDLTNDEDPDCIFEAMLLEIVTGQNMQIQMMYDLLDVYRYPEADNCEVRVETTDIFTSDADQTMSTTNESGAAPSSRTGNGLLSYIATGLGMLLWLTWH